MSTPTQALTRRICARVLQAQIPTPAPTPVPAPLVGNPTYAANIAPLLSAKCSACHNTTTMAGGMDLTTYAGLMKGGKDGAVIVPGDSANSLLVKIQSEKHFIEPRTGGTRSGPEMDRCWRSGEMTGLALPARC